MLKVSMRSIKQLNNKGFGLLGILIVIIVIIVLAAVSGAGVYVYYKQRESKTTAAVTSSNVPLTTESGGTSVPPANPVQNPYAGWKTAAFLGDNVSLRYPTGWTTSTDSTTQDLLLTKASGKGNLIIRLGFATGGLMSAAGGNHGYRPVSTFTFNSQKAYIVSDSYGGVYYLSSCAAPSLCFFKSKTQPQYGIDLDLTYFASGQQDEAALPNDASAISEAVKIMSSLSY